MVSMVALVRYQLPDKGFRLMTIADINRADAIRALRKAAINMEDAARLFNVINERDKNLQMRVMAGTIREWEMELKANL